MKILVLCHGNICRSPVAAAILTKHLSPVDHMIRQGGFVNPGRRSPPKIREWAQKKGLNLDKHRSRLATREDALWADEIVYMDGGNLRRLNALLEGAEAKKTPLAASIGLLTVPDPNFMRKDTDAFFEAMKILWNASVDFARTVR